MSHRKWNEEQINGILKQVEAGRTVAEVCRSPDCIGKTTTYNDFTSHSNPRCSRSSFNSAAVTIR